MATTGMNAGTPCPRMRSVGCVIDEVWGVRPQVQDADQMAKALGTAADPYHEQDQQAADAGKVIRDHGGGQPHLSEAENTSKSQRRVSR